MAWLPLRFNDFSGSSRM